MPNLDNQMLEGFRKLIEEDALKVTLTPEERKQVNEMMLIQKRSNDPEHWKGIIFGG